MPRSEVTIDLGALRRNVERLRGVLGGTELWAVVKADGYGHGAADVAGGRGGRGRAALCVATVAEGLSLRRVLHGQRIVVLGPTDQVREAREAGLELVVGDGRMPEDVPVHVKLDTGMGRYGFRELPDPHQRRRPDDPPGHGRLRPSSRPERQLARFREATAGTELTLHAANSAAALRLPESRLDAARIGIALYGLSPFGTDPADDGLEPVLSWRSELAQVKRLAAGREHGLREDASSRSGRRGSGSSRSATRTASGET